MRDEWSRLATASPQPSAVWPEPGVGRREHANSLSSQGLTRVGRQTGLDRGATLNLAARAMKLKIKTQGAGKEDLKRREVSERRQVGDAESTVNPPTRSTSEGGEGPDKPWWKTVTMEEGM